MDRSLGPIGVFDSGVGGISVLRELVRELPQENFIYYGDSAYAPYGGKSTDAITGRCFEIIDYLLGHGAKAVVIACNTATAAAVLPLRLHYKNIPIIGIEPAIRPASLAPKHNRVLVMATPVTLRLEKYRNLSKELSEDTEFISLACDGLAKRVEKGNLDSPDVESMLHLLLDPYVGKVDSIVLGCTHYPFVKKQIREIMGDIPFYDGGHGTALQLRRRLTGAGMLNSSEAPGTVQFHTSASEETLPLYDELYRISEFI